LRQKPAQRRLKRKFWESLKAPQSRTNRPRLESVVLACPPKRRETPGFSGSESVSESGSDQGFLNRLAYLPKFPSTPIPTPTAMFLFHRLMQNIPATTARRNGLTYYRRMAMGRGAKYRKNLASCFQCSYLACENLTILPSMHSNAEFFNSVV
jgi:hypothetical protein